MLAGGPSKQSAFEKSGQPHRELLDHNMFIEAWQWHIAFLLPSSNISKSNHCIIPSITKSGRLRARNTCIAYIGSQATSHFLVFHNPVMTSNISGHELHIDPKNGQRADAKADCISV
jgi:hypothetical protein